MLARSFTRDLPVFKQSISVLSAVPNSSGMLKDLAYLPTNIKAGNKGKLKTVKKAKISASYSSGDNIVSYTIYFVLQTHEWIVRFQGFVRDVECFINYNALQSVAEIQINDQYDSVQGRIK